MSDWERFRCEDIETVRVDGGFGNNGGLKSQSGFNLRSATDVVVDDDRRAKFMAEFDTKYEYL